MYLLSSYHIDTSSSFVAFVMNYLYFLKYHSHFAHTWTIDFYKGPIIQLQSKEEFLFDACSLVESTHGASFLLSLTGDRYRGWFISLLEPWHSAADPQTAAHQLTAFVQIQIYFKKSVTPSSEWLDTFPRYLE